MDFATQDFVKWLGEHYPRAMPMWACWQAATEAERERCAQVAEEFDASGFDEDEFGLLTETIAAAIRKGEKE